MRRTRPRSTTFGWDSNGNPTERTTIDGQTVVFHHVDLPESDITTVRGIRCTTPIRTVIDIAVDLKPDELDVVMADCLARGLFTLDEMQSRLDRPDMAGQRGAELIREHIRARSAS